LAIPLHDLYCLPLHYCIAATGKILFYNLLICKSDLFSGCVFNDFAFHAVHLPGTCANTWSAASSLENAQNTHAPEPVILASP